LSSDPIQERYQRTVYTVGLHTTQYSLATVRGAWRTPWHLDNY